MTYKTIALAGNPNSGKTTLFNALTGARQKVGNWPGVTVEKKSGDYTAHGQRMQIIDLPGTYSLCAQPAQESMDEKVARDFLYRNQADVIINIVDASNLERNLYLTTQLLELGHPLVVALNKTDINERRDIRLDVNELSVTLGCPVIPISATKNIGFESLILKALDQANKISDYVPQYYESAIESVLQKMADQIGVKDIDLSIWKRRWLALKILEGENINEMGLDPSLMGTLSQTRADLIQTHGEDLDLIIADAHFTFANSLAHRATLNEQKHVHTFSDKIDKVVLNRITGPLLFLGLMYTMFMITINLGSAFIDFFDLSAAALFVDGFGSILDTIGAPVWLRIILADGIGGGIQVVATFIPIIGFLYLCLSILEDSGYMARAAFLMDRLMRKIGLPGKAFVPLIVGFGCNVPTIMATRTLDKQSDRIMTAMMAPFMSCGARLAVYALFAAAFFPSGGQNIVFLLYLIGIAAAVATGALLKQTILQGETSPFLMELPPYNFPSPKGVVINAWQRLKGFLFGAGKTIIIVVTILTGLNSLGVDGSFGNENSEKSILSEVGKIITPLLSPLGVTSDNWPASVGIFTGIFAKEAVVGTLDALYSGLSETKRSSDIQLEESRFNLPDALMDAAQTIPDNLSALSSLFLDPLGLSITNVDGGTEDVMSELELTDTTLGAMASRFDGPAGAFAYLLFILLYTPCVAALGAITRELGGKWTGFAVIWTTGVAFSVSVSFYQIMRFDRAPITASLWLAGIGLSIGLTFIIMKQVGKRQSNIRSEKGSQIHDFTKTYSPSAKDKERFGEGSSSSSCH
ncbi:MAG: Fe(2+) transporter permease subunit FeoB [Sneathiella sp.]